MAESKRRPRKLKGAVLVMVVTLLFVLVVMLLATLTVVSNANRRTITKYEENQAYYTARSALEVYIDEMLEDEAKSTNGSAVESALKSAGFSFDADAQQYLNNLSSNKDFDGQALTNGFVHQQEILSYLEPKYKLQTDLSGNLLYDGNYFDPKDSSYWDEREDGKNGYDSDDSYIEYTATLPKTDVSTGYANDKSGLNIGKIADGDEVNIKVELLRIVYYDLDGNVLTDGVYKSSNPDNLDGTDLKVSRIDWNKTYIRLKVTAATSISDSTGGVNEATISVLLEPSPVISPKGFNNAMTSLNSTMNDCKVFTIGGASASFGTGTYTLPNNSALVGNYVYQAGQIHVDTTTEHYTPASSYFVVEGGFFRNTNGSFTITGNGKLNETDSKELAKRPFMYAEGASLYKASIGTSTTTGACDLIVVKGSGGLGNSADVWIPTINGADASDAALVINQDANYFYGDVYCDGDMYITGDSCVFYGDVHCTGNIYISGNATGIFASAKTLSVGGDIFNSSGISMTDTTGLSESDIENNANKIGKSDYIVNDSVTASYSGLWDLTGELNDDKKYEINLPNRGVTEIPPVDNVQDPYVYGQDDADNDAIPAGKTVGDIISATEMFSNSLSLGYDSTDASLKVSPSAPSVKSNIAPKTVMILNKDGTQETYSGNFIEATNGFYNGSTGLYEFKMDCNEFNNDNNTYYIDTTAGNVQIQLTGYSDSARPTFIVLGDNSVVFTVADDDTATLCEPKILTPQIQKMLNDGSTFILGDEIDEADKGNPEAPNIFFYVGKDSELTCYNGSGFLFSGYMYGPEARFYANTNTGTDVKYTYNGSAQSTQSHVSIFGSMVFNEIETQTDLGVVYISPDTNSGAATGTRMTWDRQRYLGR